MPLTLLPLTAETAVYHQQAADLLRKTWRHSYGECAEEEIAACMDPERIAIAAVEGERLLGFIGAIPQYGSTGWELHPLVVDEHFRSRGIGTALCQALESALRERGCVTVFLGSDDEDSSTTLSDTNLFDNTFEKIAAIENKKRHPFAFYQKCGYQIVGVIPDANGIGKPDIWMAKSLVNQVNQEK